VEDSVEFVGDAGAEGGGFGECAGEFFGDFELRSVRLGGNTGGGDDVLLEGLGGGIALRAFAGAGRTV
jgi:hypothetical protein